MRVDDTEKTRLRKRALFYCALENVDFFLALSRVSTIVLFIALCNRHFNYLEALCTYKTRDFSRVSFDYACNIFIIISAVIVSDIYLLLIEFR